MDANSVRNMYSNIAVTNKHTAKLHHVGSFYIYYLMMHGNPNIKHTHSEYVILIAFPLQQWLNERASMLRHTYIACLVFVTIQRTEMPSLIKRLPQAGT